MSSETHPIKVTNLDSEKIRANEIAIENSKTGKVTAVVAVMYLSKDKLCNSRSAKRKLLVKDHQKSANKSEKSKRLARIRQNVALRAKSVLSQRLTVPRLSADKNNNKDRLRTEVRIGING